MDAFSVSCSFLLTFRALGRNHIASTHLLGPPQCFILIRPVQPRVQLLKMKIDRANPYPEVTLTLTNDYRLFILETRCGYQPDVGWILHKFYSIWKQNKLRTQNSMLKKLKFIKLLNLNQGSMFSNKKKSIKNLSIECDIVYRFTYKIIALLLLRLVTGLRLSYNNNKTNVTYTKRIHLEFF